MSIEAKDRTSKPNFAVLRFYGYGQDETPEAGLDKITSPIVHTFSPLDRVFATALLQGGVTGSFSDKGVALGFRALYGTWRYDREMGAEMDDNITAPRKFAKHNERHDWEKFASDLGYWAFMITMEAMDNVEMNRYAKFDEKWIEMVLENLNGLESDIFYKLDHTLLRQGGLLKDDKADYRWIGLKTKIGNKITNPTTQIIYPSYLPGNKDLMLKTSVNARTSDTNEPVSPFSDYGESAVICGLIHAFEDQDEWNEGSAIRAALMHYVFEGNFEPTRLMAAAARAGVIPRLGSLADVKMPVVGQVNWFAKRLFALGKAWQWIANKYPKIAWSRKTCNVKYELPTSGLTSAVTDELTKYFNFGFAQIKESASGVGADGVFWMPANNGAGAIHDFAFVREATEEKTQNKMLILTGPMIQMKYDSNPLVINKSTFMDLTLEEQKGWPMRPVISVPIDTVYTRIRFWEAGVYYKETTIKDRTYTEISHKPSAMIKTLIAGWRPAFEPNALIMNSPYRGTSVFGTYERFGFYLTLEREDANGKSVSGYFNGKSGNAREGSKSLES